MATYVPNATQVTEPVESRTVESAALEFRTLKTSVNSRIAAEETTRGNADTNLQGQITALSGAIVGGSVAAIVTSQEIVSDGVTATYTLSASVDTSLHVDLYIDGAHQQPSSYTVVFDQLTLLEVPHIGALMTVKIGKPIGVGTTDALLVEYTPAGTGAVATTVQAKLRESVSVLDFGSNTNPGTTNMTSAFQNAAATGHSLFVPAGTYSVNGTITLAKGQYIRGEGRNLTIIKTPDAFASVLILLNQGSGVYDLTLTKTTVGTYSSTGTAIQVNDGGAGDSWNTTVKNVLIQNFNIADNITNYRHLREGVMYFYNKFGTVVGFNTGQAAGTVLIDACAYLYTYTCGLWARSTNTHTQVKATTFEFSDKHIVCDGVLYIDSCYIADQGAFCITGAGRIYMNHGLVTPFSAGAITNGSVYGYNFVTTDNEYCMKVAKATVDNTIFQLQYQFENGDSKRGAVIGPGEYTFNNCYLGNEAYASLYPLEYSSTVNQQFLRASKNIPNFVTNGTFVDRAAAFSNLTSTGLRNAWGGDIKALAASTASSFPYAVPTEFSLGDPMLLMVFMGYDTGAGEIDIGANGVFENTTDAQSLVQYSSKVSANTYRTNTGIAYGPTSNVALTCLIVNITTRTGSIGFASWGGSSKIHGVVLTPLPDASVGKPIGWFQN